MRFFFFLAVAGAVLASGCRIDEVEQFVDDVRVVARIGVLADPAVGKDNAAVALKRALTFFRQSKVDAVALVGKVTNSGRADQRAMLDRIWTEVFGNANARLIAEPGTNEVNGFTFALAAERPYGRHEVLTFYGGRKLALTDELCFFPRNSRVVCAGSMNGIEIPVGFKNAGMQRKVVGVAQGLLVSSYSDRTVIRRIDFSSKTPEDVAEPWTVGEDGKADDPGTDAEFAADTRLRVVSGYLGKEPVYTVSWPNVLQRVGGARSYWYEVSVAFADAPEGVFLRRGVLSDGFYRSEKHDMGGTKTVLKASELPMSSEQHKEIVVSVVPIGCLGRRGRPLVSPALPLPR